MRRWRSALEALFGAFWYLAVVVALPSIVLMGLGLVYLWQRGSLLLVLGGWLAVTALAYAGYAVSRHLSGRRKGSTAADAQKTTQAQAPEGGLPERLDERPDWGERDRQVWEACCTEIEQALAGDLPWEALQDYSLKLLARVSEHYHPSAKSATWRFTLPEALLIAEEASRRYRAVVVEHVPFADRITIGSVLSIYRRREQIKTGFTWWNRARRLGRLANPLGALLGEVRDHLTNRVFERVSTSMQTALKRLLLQEIAQASIDLYSGRLKVSEVELAGYRSEAAVAAHSRRPAPVEPLNAVVLGQISAGKSSLINALVSAMQAETDRLPTTDQVTVHRLQVEDEPEIQLTDTPGIEGDGKNQEILVALAMDADLLVWVSRATQPARAGDHALLEEIRARFEADPERRPPPSILVLTHIDALSPKAHWSPPYDLEAGSGKSRSIRDALESVRRQIGFDDDTPAIPVCLSPRHETYNVDTVSVQILALAEAAAQSQLNRRRLERSRRSVDWGERWQQVRKLGVALGKTVAKR